MVSAPRIAEGMSFFLDHLPPDVRVMILSRSDPPFSLTRLRARGETCEVYAPDLAFAPDEAQAFFEQTLGVAPTPALLAQVDARVEGWAAGLRLIALALQGRGTANGATDELGQALTDASDPWRFSEYFVSEVLNVQPEPVQRFLLLISGFPRISGGLASAVTGQEQSTVLLATLERAGLFLEPPHDGEWYRFHALFAEVMQHEARRRLGAAELRAAARRASAWYAAHGMTPEAIEAALQGEDFARAAVLIEEYVGPHLFILGSGRFNTIQEFDTLHRWLTHLPENELQRHPALCLIFATTLLSAFYSRPWTPDEMARMTAALDAAEAGWRARRAIRRGWARSSPSARCSRASAARTPRRSPGQSRRWHGWRLTSWHGAAAPSACWGPKRSLPGISPRRAAFSRRRVI